MQRTATVLVPEIRRGLRRAADPARAGPMRAYMKSRMPFLGVAAPDHRRLCRELCRRHPLGSLAQWRAAVLTLWREARYREERYAALNVAGEQAYAAFHTARLLPMYEEMVVDGAWWDYVDWIAGRLLGEILRRDPVPTKKRLRAWARSRDVWKRRAAILCQLKLRGGTDLALLRDCIEPSIERPEFFLRKGIGWALREHAKTDPGWVLRFVEAPGARLSRLTKREALRNVLPPERLRVLLDS